MPYHRCHLCQKLIHSTIEKTTKITVEIIDIVEGYLNLSNTLDLIDLARDIQNWRTIKSQLWIRVEPHHYFEMCEKMQECAAEFLYPLDALRIMAKQRMQPFSSQRIKDFCDFFTCNPFVIQEKFASPLL